MAPLYFRYSGLLEQQWPFDGTISGGGEAELGKLAEPVRYIVKEGRIQEIQGGEQADILRAYYKKTG